MKKILASKKKLLVVTLSLFVLFGGLGSFFLQGRDDVSSSVPSSSELGIGAFSPLGESGGSAVPASCPSDLHDAPWYGQPCASAANSCGQTSSGTYNCDGSCSVGPPPVSPSYGQSCTSAANVCGETTYGTYNCSGVCSASAPALTEKSRTNMSCSAWDGDIYGDGDYFCYGGTVDVIQYCNQTWVSWGYDNNTCAEIACSCSSDGSCSAPAPACGTTTYGTDNCGVSCSNTGAACAALPTSSVSVWQDPVPYGSNADFKLSSTNAAYCYVYVDSSTYIVNGYTTSGTFNYGPFTSQGLHWVQSYCFNSAWIGQSNGWSTTYFNVSAPVIPATLHICPPSATVALNGTNNLHAWYTPIGTSFIDCSNLAGASDVTVSTSWTSSATANVTVDNGTSKGLVTGKTASSSSLINAGYAGVAAAITVNVAACSPTITCASQSGGYCNGESFSVPDNGCGTSLTCTNAGTRYCDYNWKEVAP